MKTRKVFQKKEKDKTQLEHLSEIAISIMDELEAHTTCLGERMYIAQQMEAAYITEMLEQRMWMSAMEPLLPDRLSKASSRTKSRKRPKQARISPAKSHRPRD